MGGTEAVLSTCQEFGWYFMIFVTVGTHEQPFDRLIRAIDEIKKNKIITDEVFVQLGYSKYIPKYCKWKRLLGNQEMNKFVHDARIIITHGGPGSIFLSIQSGKMPIVVPRQKIYKEHVDNHQVLFTKHLEHEKKVISVFDIKQLTKIICNYKQLSLNKNNNNALNDSKKFSVKFEELINKLMKN